MENVFIENTCQIGIREYLHYKYYALAMQIYEYFSVHKAIVFELYRHETNTNFIWLLKNK